MAEQLLELHRPLRVRNPGGRPSSSIPSDTNPLRLVGKCFLFAEDLSNQIISARHFPSLIPETEAQGSNTRRRCYVCMHTQHGKKRERTLNIYVQNVTYLYVYIHVLRTTILSNNIRLLYYKYANLYMHNGIMQHTFMLCTCYYAPNAP